MFVRFNIVIKFVIEELLSPKSFMAAFSKTVEN